MENSNSNSQNLSYLTVLKQTLLKLHKFLIQVVKEDKKNSIVKLHELPDPILLFGIINLKIELLESETNRYINDYGINIIHKPKLLEYLSFIIEIGQKIKTGK